MAAYNIDFGVDKIAEAKGELTLHISKGNQRSGMIPQQSSWPGPGGYTRIGGSPNGSTRPLGANRVTLQADHVDRG